MHTDKRSENARLKRNVSSSALFCVVVILSGIRRNHLRLAMVVVDAKHKEKRIPCLESSNLTTAAPVNSEDTDNTGTSDDTSETEARHSTEEFSLRLSTHYSTGTRFVILRSGDDDWHSLHAYRRTVRGDAQDNRNPETLFFFFRRKSADFGGPPNARDGWHGGSGGVSHLLPDENPFGHPVVVRLRINDTVWSR